MTYKLYCFRDSGFSYKVALALNIMNIPWTPSLIDYHGGETRTHKYTTNINILGECPVLELNDGTKLAQSTAILQYLADKKNILLGNTKLDRYSILKWLSFDNHKFSGPIASHRYNHFICPGSMPKEVDRYLFSRVRRSLEIVERQLEEHSYIAETKSLTIADISIAAYLLYPENEFAFSIQKQYKAIATLLSEIKEMPRFKSPDEIFTEHQ